MNFVEELRWRGMLHDMMPGTEELLAKEQVTAYIRYDLSFDNPVQLFRQTKRFRCLYHNSII